MATATITATTKTTIATSDVVGTATTRIGGVDVPKQTIDAVAGLEPKELWRQFAALSAIPRASGNEGAVLAYLKKFAEDRNYKWKQDNAGNLVVFKPGAAGKDVVVVQGHVDMVAEKDADSGRGHDFARDPLLLRRVAGGDGSKSGWIMATGTTLGADNGIGVAASLALLDNAAADPDDLPPIAALFTVDEETGLTGAMKMDAEALGLLQAKDDSNKKRMTMLNLDSEDWGELYVGCAGLGETTITIPVDRRDEKGASLAVEIRVSGLMGGHSGLNIHEGRANAVQLCAAAASAAIRSSAAAAADVGLVSIRGGDKQNAIPREAAATLSLPAGGGEGGTVRAAVEAAVQKSLAAARAEYGLLETGLRMEVIDCDNNADSMKPMTEEAARRLLSTLLALPHGPIKFSHAMPDLVETSNNVASVSCGADAATILCSTRSSVGDAMEAARDKIAAVADLAGHGAAVVRSEPYPGWNPDMKSPVLNVARRLLKEKHLDGREPGVKAIHAGLECGILIEKLGGNIDVVSFGPTIHGAHSPDERVQIDTVQPFYELVRDLLKELAK